MTATRTRKHAPNFAKEIAAIVRAGLLPRIISRPDGSVELTGLPPEPAIDVEAEMLGWKIDFATKRGIQDERLAAIVDAQREIIASMLWMVYGPLHIKARPRR